MVVLIVDHIYPAATEKARNSVWTMDDFAKGVRHPPLPPGQGVIHQLMYEKHRANPGELVVIADSHTGTCGGYGAIGIGVGSTELAAAMATGKLDLEVPEVIQIHPDRQAARQRLRQGPDFVPGQRLRHRLPGG